MSASTMTMEKANKIAQERIAELEAESAGRMRRIEKLVALCHEYGIPMEKVLDTGLKKPSPKGRIHNE